MTTLISNYPIVTATAAAALGLLQTVLSVFVSSRRRKINVGIGDGGDKELVARIRAHGNLTENVPIFLILLALIETSARWTSALPWIAAIFVGVRIFHAFGMARPSPNVWRVAGAGGSLVIVFALALLLLATIRQLVLAG